MDRVITKNELQVKLNGTTYHFPPNSQLTTPSLSYARVRYRWIVQYPWVQCVILRSYPVHNGVYGSNSR